MNRMKKYISIILILSFVLAANIGWTKQTGDFSLPKYEKFTLKNGMTIYLMEQHEVPLIYVSGMFIAGAVQDGDKNGLADMTASALMYGTEKHTKAELEEELDFIGAGLNVSAGREFAGIDASFAVKDQEKVFEFIHEVLTQPIFDEEEFKKAKTRRISQLKQAKESPNNVIGNYANSFLFKDHPYANPVGGTLTGVESVSLEDVKKFYQLNYNSANACMAVVGDFDAKAMRKKIKVLFDGWKAKPINEFTMAKPNLEFTEAGMYFINKDDATLATFVIGGKGVARNNENYVALSVINTIMGGRFTSWLNNELRVNHGLTYGARSSFSARKLGGTFLISTFSGNETSVEAIDRTLNMIDSLHTTGINAETLQSAKNYVKGRYPTRFETSGNLAGLLTDMHFYNFDEKFINEFTKNVDELSVERTKELVAKYFPKENLQFVIIGKKEFFGNQLDKYGTIVQKEITDEGF